MRNTIQEFWEEITINGHNYNKQQLIDFFTESYTEDFIENIDKWKANLYQMNTSVKDTIKNRTNFNLSKWKDITFDQFCQGVIKKATEYINAHGQITSVAVENIVEIILQDHLNDLDLNIVERIENASINDLLKSMNRLEIFI